MTMEEMAYLLAQGEIAKSESIDRWCQKVKSMNSSAFTAAAEIVLLQMCAAHNNAAIRYLKIASGEEEA